MRIVSALEADGRPRPVGDRATAACGPVPVSRADDDTVIQPQQTTVEGVIETSCQLLQPGLTQEIGSAHASGEQRVPGEDHPRAAFLIVEQIAHVSLGVAGGGSAVA